MSGLFRKLFAFPSSYGLAVVVVLWLFVLTLFGTLEHCNTELSLHAAQGKYFDSILFRDFYLTLPFIDPLIIRAPLPGAQLTLMVLFVNLIYGGMVRLRKSKRTIGIFIGHIGIAVMLLAGFVKYYYADDGHLSLYPGQRAAEFESYTFDGASGQFSNPFACTRRAGEGNHIDVGM